MRRDLIALAGFVLLCLAVGGLGSVATASSVGSWYQQLAKPSFNPPDWVFAPVWTTLYVMIAIAGWRVWRRRALRGLPLMAYALQLALNLLWTVLFFGLRSPAAGAVEIVPLFAAILWTAVLFLRHDRWAGLLFLPYLLWVGFAAVLTVAIWSLN
ncbi:MAG: TspO/MBR family protein [Alphaproteobacteria bacterium]